MTGFPNFGAANAARQELPPAEPPSPRTLERTAEFQRLGFTETDAGLLAVARPDGGFLVHAGYVKKLLGQGATHAQVVAIIL